MLNVEWKGNCRGVAEPSFNIEHSDLIGLIGMINVVLDEVDR